MTGILIAVEGPNGVGKSTIISAGAPVLSEALGVPVRTTKEPSETPLGDAIRELEPTLPREALALACAADRVDHIHREIAPWLDRGDCVITDRYLPSSLVLQRLDGLDIDWLLTINKSVRPADLTVFLEDDPERIIERLEARPGEARFESARNTPRELNLYNEARTLLAEAGWPTRSINCRGLTAEECGRLFAAIALEFARSGT